MSLQCRVCLFKVDTDSSTNLFSEIRTGVLISEVLTNLAPVNISPGDGLPDRICLNCKKKLIDVLDFRSLLISSNSELQKLATTTSCNQSFIKQNVPQNIETIEDFIKVEPETLQEDSCASSLNVTCSTCDSTIHEPNKPLVCHECDEAFTSDSLFQEHRKLIHNETGYRCHKCGVLIQTHQSFENDMEHSKFDKDESKDDSNASISDVKKNGNACSIPERSRERYQNQFHLFNNWRKKKGVKGVNEDLIMSYIYEKSLNCKPSSLWAFTSMLKTTLLVYENVDIGKFTKVTSFLKKKSLGYKPKKSSNLNKQDVDKFLREAPDDKYLMIKVATIFGINGACRREELYKLQVNNIEDRGEVLVVNIPDSKTSVPRTFTIIGDLELELYRRYASLRPSHVNHNSFFISYHNGKCNVQPVGIKSFGKFPNMVASFLGLKNPESYTGRCYRRSSATLTNAGGHGSWKSGSIAESYADTLTNQVKIARMTQSQECDTGSISD